MKIHALASRPHFERHLLPIMLELDELTGTTVTGRQAHDRDIPAGDLVMVASYEDAMRVRRHDVIYVEHGAGQQYKGVVGEAAMHYHGADHPSHVIAYICPRQAVADAWDRPSVAVGCPAIDMVSTTVPTGEFALAWTWHWNASRVAPEARTARPHYVDAVEAIVNRWRRQGVTVIGHWHPRDTDGPAFWRRIRGVELVANPDEVLARSHVVIGDNTSLLYEAAYAGRGVAHLNAPWYRRDVEHGLRFWSAAPGVGFDGPRDLLDFEPAAWWESGDWWDSAQNAAVAAYDGPISDGSDGLRAALWLHQFVDGL